MNEEELEEVAEKLDGVIQDEEIPANVRDSLKEARDTLLDSERDPSQRAAGSINVLNDVSNDPNLPMHTRTVIWNISGELESATVE